MRTLTFLVFHRDGSMATFTKEFPNDWPPSVQIMHAADRVVQVSDRGEVKLLKCREVVTKDDGVLLPALRHLNPYGEDDRRMKPRDVWADGYRAGREDATR